MAHGRGLRGSWPRVQASDRCWVDTTTQVCSEPVYLQHLMRFMLHWSMGMLKRLATAAAPAVARRKSGYLFHLLVWSLTGAAQSRSNRQWRGLCGCRASESSLQQELLQLCQHASHVCCKYTMVLDSCTGQCKQGCCCVSVVTAIMFLCSVVSVACCGIAV